MLVPSKLPLYLNLHFRKTTRHHLGSCAWTILQAFEENLQWNLFIIWLLLVMYLFYKLRNTSHHSKAKIQAWSSLQFGATYQQFPSTLVVKTIPYLAWDDCLARPFHECILLCYHISSTTYELRCIISRYANLSSYFFMRWCSNHSCNSIGTTALVRVLNLPRRLQNLKIGWVTSSFSVKT